MLFTFVTLKNLINSAPNHVRLTSCHMLTTTTNLAQSYYEILGVKSNCSQREIRLAYLELCKKYHPDKLGDSQHEADKCRFQKINEAYNCLSKTGRRAEYDCTLRANSAFHNPSRSPGYGPFTVHNRRDPFNHQYYHNVYHEMYYRQMRYENELRRARAKQRSEGIIFGSTFVAIVFCSILVVSILQTYTSYVERQSFKTETEQRYEKIANMYQQMFILFKENSKAWNLEDRPKSKFSDGTYRLQIKSGHLSNNDSKET